MGTSETNTTTGQGDIPQQVKDEMIAFENVEIEQMILDVLMQRAGYANTDTIIFMLWDKKRKKVERTRLQRRLKSLCDQLLLEKQPKPRGFWKLTATGMRIAQEMAAKSPVPPQDAPAPTEADKGAGV